MSERLGEPRGRRPQRRPAAEEPARRWIGEAARRTQRREGGRGCGRRRDSVGAVLEESDGSTEQAVEVGLGPGLRRLKCGDVRPRRIPGGGDSRRRWALKAEGPSSGCEAVRLGETWICSSPLGAHWPVYFRSAQAPAPSEPQRFDAAADQQPGAPAANAD